MVELIGIDTCTWEKIFDLMSKEVWKPLIFELLNHLNIFITVEVQRELFHFHNEEEAILKLIETLKIYPVLNETLQEYQKRGFDIADASLLEYSEQDDYMIITEDGGMLAEGITDKNNILSLIDLLLALFNQGLITRKEMYHLTKYLRKNRNIRKSKEGYALDLINIASEN